MKYFSSVIHFHLTILLYTHFMTGSNKSGNIAVHCRNITKTYGEGAAQVHALRGVDLDVYRAELMMIVGPSGCGKTTFVSIVSALLEPDGGVCEVFGHDVPHLSEKAKTLFRRYDIGFVFQAFNLLPALTAQENVAVPLLVQGIARKEAMKRAAEALVSVGQSDRHGALPSQLSGGQKQRVAIARAMVHRPKLIICDEPTSNLDHATGHMVMELLKNLTEKSGTTLIVVTHDNRIFDFADRIAHMDDGRILNVEIIHPKKRNP
jgi:putative ABC transport system ATP-binding protein